MNAYTLQGHDFANVGTFGRSGIEIVAGYDAAHDILIFSTHVANRVIDGRRVVPGRQRVAEYRLPDWIAGRVVRWYRETKNGTTHGGYATITRDPVTGKIKAERISRNAAIRHATKG